MVAAERLNGQDHEHIEQEVQRESNGRADARTDAAEGGNSPGTVDEDIVGQDVYGHRHERDDHRQARAAMCIDEVAQDTGEEDRHDADGNGKEIPRGDLPDLRLQCENVQDGGHKEDAEQQENTRQAQRPVEALAHDKVDALALARPVELCDNGRQDRDDAEE